MKKLDDEIIKELQIGIEKFFRKTLKKRGLFMSSYSVTYSEQFAFREDRHSFLIQLKAN
jgi:hypothetical protein